MPLPTNVQPRGVVPNEVYGVLLALRAANTFYDFLVERAPDALTVQSAAVNAVRNSHYEHGVRTTLLEGGSTQLWAATEDLTNAAWRKSANTVIPNATIAPDGNFTADKYVQNVTGADNFIHQPIDVIAGTPARWTVFAKAAGYQWIKLQYELPTPDGTKRVWLDTLNGVVGTIEAGMTATATPLANGWYRFDVSFTPTASATARPMTTRIAASDGGTTTIIGNGTDGVYLWGYNFRNNPVRMSYVPNPDSTSVASAADLIGWTIPDSPHAMEWIIEFIERGMQQGTGGQGIAYLGNDAHTGAQLYVMSFFNPKRYGIVHDNGDGVTNFNSYANQVVSDGDRVRLRCVIYTDGSVQAFQSVNGGQEVAGARSPAHLFAPAWGGQTFRLNSIGTGSQGSAAYISALLFDTSSATKRLMLQITPDSLGAYTASRSTTATFTGLSNAPDETAIETFRCVGSQKQYADQRANDGKRWWYRARHVAPLGVTNLGSSDPTDWVSGYPRLITDIGTVIHLDRAPTAPKVYAKFLPGGGLQVFWQGDTDTASVKIAASTTSQPTLDDVRATTAYVGDTGATNGALLTVGTGQRFYVSAVAYNAAGVESTMFELADTRLGLNVDRDEALVTAIPQTFSTQITYAISMSDSVAFAEMWVKETGTNPGTDIDIAHQSGARKFTTIYNKDGRQLTINVPVSIPGNYVTVEFLPYDILGLPGTTSVTVAQSKAVPESGPPGAPSFVGSTSTSITMQSNLATSTQAGDTVRFYRHEILQLAGSQPDALQGTVVVQATDVTNGYVRWTDTTVHTGHTYGYEATVQEAGFNESPKTASTTMQPAAATKINTPMLGAGSYSTSSASIPFTITPGANTPAGATYHLLQYEGSDPTNGVYAEVKTTTGTSFSYSVSQQSTSRILYFKVYATATDWTTSDNSAYVQVTIPAYTPPEGGGGGGGGGTQLEEPV